MQVTVANQILHPSMCCMLLVLFLGTVAYNLTNWLEKNKDPLNDTVVDQMKRASNKYELFGRTNFSVEQPNCISSYWVHICAPTTGRVVVLYSQYCGWPPLTPLLALRTFDCGHSNFFSSKLRLYLECMYLDWRDTSEVSDPQLIVFVPCVDASFTVLL